MAVSEALIQEQLPHGAQKSIGETKQAVGVIDEGLFTEGDILANQALMMARARHGIAYEEGAEFGDNFVKEMRKLNTPKQFVHQRLNEATLNAIQQGSQQRDQQYIGGNQEWTGYYLEPLAKFIVPFDTPFRNMLPRTPSVGIDTENWRAITDVFGGSGPSVGAFILAQQTSPQKAIYSWVDKSNIYRQIAFSDIVTIESELYGRMFEPDVRAKVAAKLAPSLMLGQEVWYLNGAQNLWAPPPASTPTTSATGGTVLANTYWFLITAVNAQGETLAYGGATPTAISMLTAGTTSTVSFTIMRVPNAVSYNIYCGIGGTQPANSAMWLQSAITQFGGATALNDPGGIATGYFTVAMTAPPATSGTAYSTRVTAGNTAVAFTSGAGGTPPNQKLVFDGIQSLTYLNAGVQSSVGTGSEVSTVRMVAAANNGTPTADDINAWLEVMYLNARANPEAILCGVKDHKALSKIVTSGTNYRVNAQLSGQGPNDLVGGGRATKWINQTTGRLMDIIMVPYLMQGTIIAVSLTLPFQVAEIDKPPLRISTNREMWALEYPPDQSHPTQWMYGAYSSETMINQYLGGTGLLSGIVTA